VTNKSCSAASFRCPDFLGFLAARWQILRANLLAWRDSFRLSSHKGEKVFIDCGSNLGQGALFFSRYFRPREWRYVLIEPNPACHARLRRLAKEKLSHGGRPAQVIPRAAWISNGTRRLYGTQKGEAAVGASLKPGHNGGVSPRKGTEFISVPTFDFGQFLSSLFPRGGRHSAPCVVMKMDIEGAETTVLPHLLKRGTVQSLRALYVEWHSRYLGPGPRRKIGLQEAALMNSMKCLTLLREWH